MGALPHARGLLPHGSGPMAPCPRLEGTAVCICFATPLRLLPF